MAVNIYVFLSPGTVDADVKLPANLPANLNVFAADAAGRKALGRGRSLLTTAGVSAAVALVVVVGLHVIGGSGSAGAAGRQSVAGSVPVVPRLALGPGQSASPADVAAALLAQQPRVTLPPGAAPGPPSGPAAFGFGQ